MRDLPPRAHSLRAIGRQVAFVVHGRVEDAGDFELSVVGAEEDDVFALGGDAASGKKIGAEPVAFGILPKVFEA
jgi:hypothetical protein